MTHTGVVPRFAFGGRELDAETGLYYNRLRYYDAGTGRFLSEDPSGFRGGDDNLYRYVGNSPLNFTDPMGLVSASTVIGAIRGTLEVGAGTETFGWAAQSALTLWDAAADLKANIDRGADPWDAERDALGRNMPGFDVGYLAAESWVSDTVTGGVGYGRKICLHEKILRNFNLALSLGLGLLGVRSMAARGPTTAVDLRGLTNEAHGLLGFKGKFVSTAVGQYSDGSLGIASSDTLVPISQAEWAEAQGIRVVNGEGHAEMTLMNGATPETGPLQSFEVSSPYGRKVVDGVPTNPDGAMCGPCADGTSQAGATTTSPVVRKPQ